LKFKLADIVEDAGILEQTRIAAQHLLAGDPSLTHPAHQPLRNILLKGTSTQNNWSKIS
jgi:RecG-like helicase